MLLGRVDFPACYLKRQSKQNSIQELRLLGDVSLSLNSSLMNDLIDWYSAHRLLRTFGEDCRLLAGRCRGQLL